MDGVPICVHGDAQCDGNILGDKGDIRVHGVIRCNEEVLLDKIGARVHEDVLCAVGILHDKEAILDIGTFMGCNVDTCEILEVCDTNACETFASCGCNSEGSTSLRTANTVNISGG